MKTLIDADILLYEVSFAAEAYWKHIHAEKGEEVVCAPPWEMVERQLTERIQHIMNETNGEGEPIIFFTGKNNFRERLAKTFIYKENRPPKPFHYTNLKVYMKSVYTFYEEEGLEADDLLGIFLTARPDRYICASRDKDLKQIPGWHYGWEVGRQAAFGPELVDEVGWLKLSPNPKNRKVTGTGAKFLHFQMLHGDSTDTIPGLAGYGVVKAFKTIDPCNTIDEMEKAVLEAYKAQYGDAAEERMVEIGRMVYMTRERKGNEIKLYTPSWREAEWFKLNET